MSDEHRHLQEIDRQIAEGRDRAIKLKRQIADLQKGGRNAVGTMGYLRELEHALRLMRDHREAIAHGLKRRQHLGAPNRPGQSHLVPAL